MRSDCEAPNWAYLTAVICLALFFLVTLFFFWRFVSGWKKHAAFLKARRRTAPPQNIYFRQVISFVLCELRVALFGAAIVETHRVGHSLAVRLLLSFSMVCHLFIWGCSYSILVTRLRLSFENSFYTVNKKQLRNYTMAYISVIILLAVATAVHYSDTTHNKGQNIAMFFIVILTYLAMLVLLAHICKSFVERLLSIVTQRMTRRQSRARTVSSLAPAIAGVSTMTLASSTRCRAFSQSTTITQSECALELESAGRRTDQEQDEDEDKGLVEVESQHSDDNSTPHVHIHFELEEQSIEHVEVAVEHVEDGVEHVQDEDEHVEVPRPATSPRALAQLRMTLQQGVNSFKLQSPKQSFEVEERNLLDVATKQSVLIGAAAVCELFAMIGFLVLSQSKPDSICMSPLHLFALLSKVGGANGLAFCVFLSFCHSDPEFTAMCSKCNWLCGKVAETLVAKRTDEASENMAATTDTTEIR